MRKIDILSQSPNNFIFQKESNKTTIGGVLSAIYIFAIIFIFFYYRAIYYLSLPYDITSYVSEEKILNEAQKQKFLKSEKYNPILQWKFSLWDDVGRNLSDRFMLYDGNTNEIIIRDKIIERRVSDIYVIVVYKCINSNNCEIEHEDISVSYQLKFFYQNFLIDPQNEKPIIKSEKNDLGGNYVTFSPDIKMRQSLIWNIVRCEDNKGLFDIFKKEVFENFINDDEEQKQKKRESDKLRENDIYIGGKLGRYETIFYSKYTIPSKWPNSSFVMDFNIRSTGHTSFIIYEDYKRKKISFFDNIPDIFALWISLYNALTFLFSKLYSTSFDKYQIIDNILSKQKKNLSKTLRQNSQISIINDVNKGDILFENESIKKPKDENLIYNKNGT